MIDWFVFNGKNSRQYGIIIDGEPRAERPEERLTNVEIPGRAGGLTLLEGEDIFSPYMQSVTINVPAAVVSDVLQWLRGEGDLTLSIEPERKQHARVVQAVQLERVDCSFPWYTGDVVFNVQPYKRPVRLETVETVEDGATVVNAGSVPAFPVFNVDAGNTDFSITVNEYTLVVTASAHEELEDGQTWRIDCDTQEVMIMDGDTLVELCTQYSTGSFPVLEKGESEITLTGVDEVQMLPRWRYL